MDDPETAPASRDDLAAALAPGAELAEFWHSPPLAASPDFGLAPGERHTLSDQAERLSDTELDRLAMVELRESEPAAFALQAPDPVTGAIPTGPDEVLVSQAVADRLALAVGDTLGFVAPPDSGVRSTDGNAAAAMQDSANGYRVSGIAAGAEYLAWAPSGWLSDLVAAAPLGVQGHWLVLGDDPVTWDQARALNDLQAFAVSRHVLEHYPSADERYPVEVDPSRFIEGAISVVLTVVVRGNARAVPRDSRARNLCGAIAPHARPGRRGRCDAEGPQARCALPGGGDRGARSRDRGRPRVGVRARVRRLAGRNRGA